jgi:hypothetical protein
MIYSAHKGNDNCPKNLIGNLERRNRLRQLNVIWGIDYMHSLSAQKLQMNDTYTNIHNPIFDLIMKHIPHNNKSLTNLPSPTTTLKWKKKKAYLTPPPTLQYCPTPNIA